MRASSRLPSTMCASPLTSSTHARDRRRRGSSRSSSCRIGERLGTRWPASTARAASCNRIGTASVDLRASSASSDLPRAGDVASAGAAPARARPPPSRARRAVVTASVGRWASTQCPEGRDRLLRRAGLAAPTSPGAAAPSTAADAIRRLVKRRQRCAGTLVRRRRARASRRARRRRRARAAAAGGAPSSAAHVRSASSIAAERVERERRGRGAPTRRAAGRHRRARRELVEDVARARRIADPQRRPAAASAAAQHRE